jgi:hypothetical protein
MIVTPKPGTRLRGRAVWPGDHRAAARAFKRHRAWSAHARVHECAGPLWPTHLETLMSLTVEHISPLIALIAGVLILIVPRLLNYIVAFYLILVGLIGLNVIHNFLR